MAARSGKAPRKRARAGVLAVLVLGLLLAPASAQADPVTAQGCTLKLKREGSQTATFRFNCAVPVITVLAQTNKLATVTPSFLTTGGAPTYFCPDATSGPGDPVDAVPAFPDSFGCSLIAINLGAQGTLQVANPCGRKKLRITNTVLQTVFGPAVIPNDVRIQGCPVRRPRRPPRPPRPPEPPEAPCTITGSPADNVIRGTTGDDVICARGGDDLVYARGGDDIVRGEAGDDVLRGQAGRDELLGGPGRDECKTDPQDTQHDC